MTDPANDGDLPHPRTGVRYPSPVPPGTGWPGDPASEATPVATSPARVRRLSRDRGLPDLDAAISVCRACPRLVDWREDVARTKRASFSGQPYWGRPVPGWGSEEPGVLVVGLAPAANGANRTGRVFTGDSSGDWLFAALHRVGLATRPTSTHAGDGQELVGTRMVATVRCAPPQNRPTTTERDTCAPWIDAEVRLLAPYVRVVVALGSYGWDGAIRSLRSAGYDVPRPKPRFGHAAEAEVPGPHRPVTLLGCYHPSQHNTFTGRLTTQMLDAVLGRARDLAGIGRS